MHILSKIIYRVNAIPNKNSMILFVEIKKKKKSKIHQESKESQIAKTILRKNIKVVTSHFLISKYISHLSKQNSMVLA